MDDLLFIFMVMIMGMGIGATVHSCVEEKSTSAVEYLNNPNGFNVVKEIINNDTTMVVRVEKK